VDASAVENLERIRTTAFHEGTKIHEGHEASLLKTIRVLRVLRVFVMYRRLGLAGQLRRNGHSPASAECPIGHFEPWRGLLPLELRGMH